jgi:fungal STAND N-terminal Goodbye domain
MSSAGQATSSPTFSIQLIVYALADYAKITGVDLSKNPFAAAIEGANSPEAILELLQERAKAFNEYRDNNRRLINCLTPAVKVIQAFSGILGEAVTLVSFKYDLATPLNRLRQVPLPLANALFVGIDVLLAVRPSNTLFTHLLCDI